MPSLLSFFKKLKSPEPIPFPGLLLDEGTVGAVTDAEIGFQYADRPVWKEKKPEEWRSYPIKNQAQSASCVAQATAKILSIENLIEMGSYIDFSARDIYANRGNKPQSGMYFYDALTFASKNGATLEVLMPSNGKNEAEMNNKSDFKPYMRRIAEIFKAKDMVQITNPSIHRVAQIIEATGKGVLLAFKFEYNEWGSVPALISSMPTISHAVTAVDYLLWEGKLALVIEDSWGLAATDLNGRRIITEEFFNKRCKFAGYLLDLSNSWQDGEPRPKVRISKPMKFDDRTVDVLALQQVLKYEKLFPTNVGMTGYYFTVTEQAVLAFKKKYGFPGDGKAVDQSLVDFINNQYQ